MVVIDTSIIIDHLRQQDSEVETHLIKLAKKFTRDEIGVSVLSIQELYSGLSTRDTEKENYLKLIISPIVILPYTYDISVLAGKIIRDTADTVAFADAGIAATCIYNNANLFTLNEKDFKKIEGLNLYK